MPSLRRQNNFSWLSPFYDAPVYTIGLVLQVVVKPSGDLAFVFLSSPFYDIHTTGYSNTV
jgi:hypothetical protein